MSARRPNRRQFDSASGPRYSGAVIRSVAPVGLSLLELAVQFDSEMVFPAVAAGDLPDALQAINLLGVDALGGLWSQPSIAFTVLGVSSFSVEFDAGMVALDSDKPWSLYVPSQSAFFRPANGGLVRGWLDDSLGITGLVVPGGWISCSHFVL